MSLYPVLTFPFWKLGLIVVEKRFSFISRVMPSSHCTIFAISLTNTWNQRQIWS